MAEPKKLSSKQLQAIDALITETNTTAAAARTGVSKATMLRWLKDDPFNAALEEAKARCGDLAREELLKASRPAARALIQELRNPSANIRLRAAKTILELNGREQINDDLERRLSLLEKKVR
jgi:hypothetical protein